MTVRAQSIFERLGTKPVCPENMLGSMATIRLPDKYQDVPVKGRIDDEQLRLYDEFGIEVPFFRIGTAAARYIRVSVQLYNTVEEYEYLADALRQID